MRLSRDPQIAKNKNIGIVSISKQTKKINKSVVDKLKSNKIWNKKNKKIEWFESERSSAVPSSLEIVTTTPKKASKKDRLSTKASVPNIVKTVETTLTGAAEKSVKKGFQWLVKIKELLAASKRSSNSDIKDKIATVKNKKKIKSSTASQDKATLKKIAIRFLKILNICSSCEEPWETRLVLKFNPAYWLEKI
jgi:hypothetical protein